MARVVVVGGGLGGTASAARLAKLGHDATLVEARDRLGGAVGFLEQDGYRWDTGPTSTALPAVLRDLFRKSGRPLERELELVPVQPVREHRFEDGTALSLPSGSRGAQLDAVDDALGAGAGRAWGDYVHAFAGPWDVLRRNYLERPYSPDLAGADLKALLGSRATLHKHVQRTFKKDGRLRRVALTHALLDGQDPRNVPSWMGLLDYVEQNFGTWTVAGGMGRLAEVLTKRLAERKVQVLLGTTVRDVVVREGRAVAVATEAGEIDADVVVVAVDPRRVPVLAEHVRRTMPALPPVVCHLGLAGDVPELPHEVVLHGEQTVVVRPGERTEDGRTAWTLLGRGRLAEDVVTALARRKIDVRENIEVRVDLSPRDQVVAWGGSPYGVQWQGRRTVGHRLHTETPVPGVYCAGVHAGAWSGVPFAALTAANVAELVGKV